MRNRLPRPHRRGGHQVGTDEGRRPRDALKAMDLRAHLASTHTTKRVVSTHEHLVFLIRIQRVLNKLDYLVKPLGNVGVHVVPNRDVHHCHALSEIPTHVNFEGGYNVRDADAFEVAGCPSRVEIREVQTGGDGGGDTTVGVIPTVFRTPMCRLFDEGVLPAGCWEGDHGAAVRTRTLVS